MTSTGEGKRPKALHTESDLPSSSRLQQRTTFDAPLTATLSPSRARSFHGTSDLDGSVWSLRKAEPGSEQTANEGAAVDPWSSDKFSKSHENEQPKEHNRSSLEYAERRHTISARASKSKGKEKAAVLGSQDRPKFPQRTVSTIGTGLEGHPRASLGGLGWDALEEGDKGQRWNARSLRDGETALDRTIDHIGMGRYQVMLLILSGFGYLADNMWLQGIAIVLPRVQDEWNVHDRWIGLLSSSTFAGMMVGALAWGSYADSYGRKDAFNGTLLVTAVFGCASSFATSFPMLCALCFLLGTGVGGSMPTDGTLFLENLPKSKQYLLTALSVFFALGSVATSVLGFLIIPANSCPDGTGAGTGVACDIAKHNQGWRWLLNGLGFLTVCFVVARLILFRLFESPKYLVATGKHQEARVVLQRIAAFNGTPLPVSLGDVCDDANREPSSDGPAPKPGRSQGYDAIPTSVDDEQDLQSGALSEQPANGTSTPAAPAGSVLDRVQSSMSDFLERYTVLFEPHWRKTTFLVWAIWTLVSLAFTIFNVFLPKFLEARLGHGAPAVSEPGGYEGRRAVMVDYLLYALASVPGSLLGAWMIETRLGRIGSMALSTGCTALSILAFTAVTSRVGVVLSSMLISVSATTAYAAIYGYTPEVFTTDIRGTACGSASALSRLAGIVAPLVAGALLAIQINLPLYLSIVLFVVCVGCMLSLPYETRQPPQHLSDLESHEVEEEDID